MPKASIREGGESCQEDQELKQGSDRSRSGFASDPLSSLRKEGMMEEKGRGQPKKGLENRNAEMQNRQQNRSE